MPFAVEMFLDSESAEVVRGAWRKLAEADVAPEMYESGAQPHISLGACDRLDVEACSQFLAHFAFANSAPTVRFSSIGIFATDPAVVFLAPVVTPDLLALHSSFQHRFPDFADTAWTYYHPNQWVPHCTLAIDCPLTTVPSVIEVCTSFRLPRDVRLDAVGIVEFRPIHHRAVFQFAGG